MQTHAVSSRRAITFIAIAVIAGIPVSVAACAAAGGTVAYFVLPPGDSIALDIMRGDSEVQVQVTLSERATT